MKKKKWIAPASCLVILALLLALYFILKNQNMEKEEETETAESVIGIGEEKATGIQFTVEGQQYSFIKEGDTWKKEDEVDFPVDQEKMSTLITTFTGLTADRTLTDISSLEEYGLDDPVNSVTLTGSDENQVTLHIGDKNKDTSDTYLYMNEDKSTVYVTGTDCEEALPDTLMDLAQSESFPSVTSTNITEVEVNNGGNIYTLTKMCIRDREEIDRVEHTYVGMSEDVQKLLQEKNSTLLNSGSSLAELIRRPELDYQSLSAVDPGRPDLPRDVQEQVSINIKYDGYIKRQLKQVDQFKKMEAKKIPEHIDYDQVGSLRIEAKQKLNTYRPMNIGQASRISGVSPADISVLLVYLGGR